MKNKYKHDESLLFLLSKAHWKLHKILSRKFRENEFGITPDQWLILLNIYNEGSMYQSELARKQFKDRAAIKRMADQLCKKNLLVRKRTSLDLRLKRLELTAEGREIVSKLNKISQQTIKRSVRDLTEVEINALKRLMGRIDE